MIGTFADQNRLDRPDVSAEAFAEIVDQSIQRGMALDLGFQLDLPLSCLPRHTGKVLVLRAELEELAFPLQVVVLKFQQNLEQQKSNPAKIKLGAIAGDYAALLQLRQAISDDRRSRLETMRKINDRKPGIDTQEFGQPPLQAVDLHSFPGDPDNVWLDRLLQQVLPRISRTLDDDEFVNSQKDVAELRQDPALQIGEFAHISRIQKKDIVPASVALGGGVNINDALEPLFEGAQSHRIGAKPEVGLSDQQPEPVRIKNR